MSILRRLIDRLLARALDWILGPRSEGPEQTSLREAPGAADPLGAAGEIAPAGSVGDIRAPTHLIVGLGNPGVEYAMTRHNIGFRVIEELAERAGASWVVDDELIARVAQADVAGESCLLVQPQTFMNRSGASVAAALARWPLSQETALLVIFDDLDLPPGRIRLRPKGGGGGHNGIGDILAQLDSKAVPRLRFGVGHPGDSGPVIDWVLAPFPEAEEEDVLPEALGRAADAVEMFVAEGVERAMGKFNGIS